MPRWREQGANPQRPGGIVDDVLREASARHHRQHLSGGSHPACAGHRRVVLLRTIPDSGELNHPLLFMQGERPQQPRELIGGGVEDAAIDESWFQQCCQHTRESSKRRRPRQGGQPNCVSSAAATDLQRVS